MYFKRRGRLITTMSMWKCMDKKGHIQVETNDGRITVSIYMPSFSRTTDLVHNSMILVYSLVDNLMILVCDLIDVYTL